MNDWWHNLSWNPIHHKEEPKVTKTFFKEFEDNEIKYWIRGEYTTIGGELVSYWYSPEILSLKEQIEDYVSQKIEDGIGV